MANRTIVLSDIKVIQWSVNVELRCVRVRYQILDDTSVEYSSGDAIFWETMPPPTMDRNGDPVPYPVEWYQLPAQYSQILTDLTLSVKNALLHLIEE